MRNHPGFVPLLIHDNAIVDWYSEKWAPLTCWFIRHVGMASVYKHTVDVVLSGIPGPQEGDARPTEITMTMVSSAPVYTFTTTTGGDRIDVTLLVRDSSACRLLDKSDVFNRRTDLEIS